MHIVTQAIPSLVNKISKIRSDAEFVLVVEKDAAFMRLAEDRFYNQYPCIIITGKGQPDVYVFLFLFPFILFLFLFFRHIIVSRFVLCTCSASDPSYLFWPAWIACVFVYFCTRQALRMAEITESWHAHAACRSTRLFLKMVRDALKIPILGLFDSDPYGLKVQLPM